MVKRCFLLSALLVAFFYSQIWGQIDNCNLNNGCIEDNSFAKLKWDIYSMQANISHTEGRGIGYWRGYTSLAIFLMPSTFKCRSIYPLLDLRGHGFNDGKIAANGGLGVRILTSNCSAIGANVYFDVRQSHHRGFNQRGHVFNQLGAGLEYLSTSWDVRLNYYQPLGKKVIHFRQTIFKDNLGITPIFLRKHQYTIRMANAELGTCTGSGSFCFCCLDWSSYFAFGPYYLEEKHHSSRWGGQARLSAVLGDYYEFEIRTSYDRVTHGTLQFRIGVNFPFYPQSRINPDFNYNRPTQQEIIRRQILTQRVRRAEIIPLSR